MKLRTPEFTEDIYRIKICVSTFKIRVRITERPSRNLTNTNLFPYTVHEYHIERVEQELGGTQNSILLRRVTEMEGLH